MSFILEYQWEIFIFLEVFSLLFLLTFLIFRYAFSKENIGRIFLFLFVLFIILEAILAFLVYQHTGEIETFQVVIIIFVIYAFTFGIADFKRLDRYIKDKVGKWRGVELLTEEDKRKMERLKDPKVIARNYRLWWYGHTFVFVLAHLFFWMNYGNDAHSFFYYVSDLSWFDGESLEQSPFTNEMIMNISMLWIIIYVVDTIISWSYTFFPSEKK
ncbi:MAG TPA: hypothetical protein VK085_05760 [Pseudogracilibacillus sp.]|nr:hypothetical protein [Pseudogracilibacillus sp.]